MFFTEASLIVTTKRVRTRLQYIYSLICSVQNPMKHTSFKEYYSHIRNDNFNVCIYIYFEVTLKDSEAVNTSRKE